MGYRITVDTEEQYRVEDDHGSAITVALEETEGRILSVFLQEDGDPGKDLLAAAEAAGEKRGLEQLDMDFYSEEKAVEEMFSSRDFTLEEGADVFSVALSDLLSSTATQKAIRSRCPDASFTALEDLFITQWDELLDLLEHFRVNFTSEDLRACSQEMSGVVYSDDLVPKAVVLCSEVEDVLHVDFLLGTTKKNPQYIMAALQGMIKQLLGRGGENAFSRMVMVGANEMTEIILRRVLDGKYSANRIGKTVHAYKEIEEPGPVKLTEEPEDGKNNAWRKEVSEAHTQGNISWKMPWFRDRKSSM